MVRRVLFSIVVGMSAGAAVASPPNDAESKSRGAVRVELASGQDSYIATTNGDGLTLKIESPRGIGRCKLILQRGSWPTVVRLSLGVKNLEGFQAGNRHLRLAGSLANQQPEVSIRDDKNVWHEAESRMQHRLAMKRVGERIEVQLPAVLFSDDEPTVDVQWIDFYR